MVVIDEVDNSFAQIFNELKRHGFPILILMTSLQNSNMVLAYERVFHCNMALAQKMTQMVKGHSYGFQLLGYLAF